MARMSKVKPDHMLPAHIPFYRTRWFWGVVFGLIVAWSLLFYFFQLFSSEHNLARIIYDLSFAFGASTLSLLGYEVLGEIGGWTGIILYIALVIFLLLQTFRKTPVVIKHPVLLLLVYLLGMYTTVQYLGSFI